MIEIHAFSDGSECAEAAADHICRSLKAGLAGRGQATFAVSGGRTPEVVFPLLASRGDVDWRRVTVTLVDERWVPSNHADSNEALVRRALLTGQAAAAAFVGLKTPHARPAEAVGACNEALAAMTFPLDVSYLGFGPDGHVASLFPDSATAWTGKDAGRGRCLAVPPSSGRLARMSMTPATLLDTRDIVLVFGGAEKRAVFDAALRPGPVSEIPLRLVVQQDRVPVHVFRAP